MIFIKNKLIILITNRLIKCLTINLIFKFNSYPNNSAVSLHFATWWGIFIIKSVDNGLNKMLL